MTSAGWNTDAQVRQALERELLERKALKTKGRIAKMKAKANGELNRMPLSGKAALQVILGKAEWKYVRLKSNR